MNLAYDFTPSCPIPLPWCIPSNQEDILALDTQKEVAVPEFKELAFNGRPMYKLYNSLKLIHQESQSTVLDRNRGQLFAQPFISFLSRGVNLVIKCDFIYHARFMPNKICHYLLIEIFLDSKEMPLYAKSCSGGPGISQARISIGKDWIQKMGSVGGPGPARGAVAATWFVESGRHRYDQQSPGKKLLRWKEKWL